jgi:hypothetical protein
MCELGLITRHVPARRTTRLLRFLAVALVLNISHLVACLGLHRVTNDRAVTTRVHGDPPFSVDATPNSLSYGDRRVPQHSKTPYNRRRGICRTKRQGGGRPGTRLLLEELDMSEDKVAATSLVQTVTELGNMHSSACSDDEGEKELASQDDAVEKKDRLVQQVHPWKGQVITTYHSGDPEWFSELATPEALGRLSVPCRHSWPIYTRQDMVMTRDKPSIAMVVEVPHDGLASIPVGFELWIRLNMYDRIDHLEYDNEDEKPVLNVTRVQDIVPASLGTLRENAKHKTVLRDVPLRLDPERSGYCLLGVLKSPGSAAGWIVTVTAAFSAKSGADRAGWFLEPDDLVSISWANVLACPPDTFVRSSEEKKSSHHS